MGLLNERVYYYLTLFKFYKDVLQIAVVLALSMQMQLI
jgi:hypothetical protein